MAKNKNNNQQAFWVVLALVIAVLLFGGFLSKGELSVEAGEGLKCDSGYECKPKGSCSGENMGKYCIEKGEEGFCCKSKACQGEACCGDSSEWKDGKCVGQCEGDNGDKKNICQWSNGCVPSPDKHESIKWSACANVEGYSSDPGKAKPPYCTGTKNPAESCTMAFTCWEKDGNDGKDDDGNDGKDGGECFIGGCSKEVCSAEQGVRTTCQYKPWYACYKNSICGKNNGTCGWKKTKEVCDCLKNEGGPTDGCDKGSKGPGGSPSSSW